MQEFSLKKLWDLRGELDKAVLDGEYEKISMVKYKYEKLTENEKIFNRAFICYNHAFWTNEHRRVHNFLNVNSIALNIKAYENKFVYGKDVSLKLKKQSNTPFLAGEIWVLRAMYDKFLLNGQKKLNELETQQNMLLGNVIKDELASMSHMDKAEMYSGEIVAILNDVKKGYESVYGVNQPRTTYSQFAEDFLEM